jgi:Flp pilus assembly protein TadG
MAPLSALRNRLRQERGAELIEMALVLPLLLLIVMGIFDFGFMFREMNVVTNAAREGARTGILPDYDDADIDARVQQYMNAAGIGVNCPSADCVI